MPQLTLPHSPKEFLDYTLTLPPGGRTPKTIVIYAHGFASDQKGEKVRYLQDRFAASGCACLTFDHRGHGASSGTMRELTVTRNLEDLDAVMHACAMGYERRILAGSSMGGQTVAWYAARHPDLIAANLLIAPGFRFLQRWIGSLGPQKLEAFTREGRMTVNNDEGEVTLGSALLDDVGRYPMEKLLPDYRTPTLIIHGIKDESVPFEDSVEFIQHSTARPLELLLIAGGDHRLTDQKETLFEAMAAFCRRLHLFS